MASELDSPQPLIVARKKSVRGTFFLSAMLLGLLLLGGMLWLRNAMEEVFLNLAMEPPSVTRWALARETVWALSGIMGLTCLHQFLGQSPHVKAVWNLMVFILLLAFAAWYGLAVMSPLIVLLHDLS